MASRNKRTTRRPSVKAHAPTNGSSELPANDTPASGGPEQGEQVAHPGVLVMRVPGENPGEENIQLIEINGMDPLAVPTLLQVACKIKSQQLGLGE